MSRTAWTYESFESGSDELAQYNEYFDTAEDAVRQAVNLVDEYPDTIAGVRKVEDESREDFEHPYKFCIATEENRREAERVFGGKFVRVSEFCAGLCESNRPRGRMLNEDEEDGVDFIVDEVEAKAKELGVKAVFAPPSGRVRMFLGLTPKGCDYYRIGRLGSMRNGEDISVFVNKQEWKSGESEWLYEYSYRIMDSDGYLVSHARAENPEELLPSIFSHLEKIARG